MLMRRRIVRRGIVAVSCLTVLLSGCQKKSESVELSWRPVTLPHPEGDVAEGDVARLMPREAVSCGGTWYVVGGAADSSGDTRPAVWTSNDGESWQVVKITPKSYYGERSVLYAAACHDGELVTIGGKSGGAHGNLRINTWYQLTDGSLVEADEPYFELFGANRHVSASRMAGGPQGWLIAGTRTSGAAVWVSPDATSYTILEDAPELRSDERGATWAIDALSTSAGWIVAGGVRKPQHIDGDPQVWTSRDGGTWTRVAAESSDAHEEIQRLTIINGSVYGVGARGGGFAVWRQAAESWKHVSDFGAGAKIGLASVSALTGQRDVFAVVSDGERYLLWTSKDLITWRRVVYPGMVTVRGDHAVMASVADNRLVLVVDDGTGGKAWVADLVKVD